MGHLRLVLNVLIVQVLRGGFSAACPGNISVDKGYNVSVFNNVPLIGIFLMTQETPQSRMALEVMNGNVTKSAGNFAIVGDELILLNAQMGDAGLYDIELKNEWKCRVHVQVNDPAIHRAPDIDTSVVQSESSSASLNGATSSHVAVLICGWIVIYLITKGW
ncbi:hypothetical protein XENTR_v10020160 [Xenopus tropicalis]|uniref:Uncharacterized protein LOC101734284 isoform X2 n=1 Tax=Xenopus tropicalis TaxID=8364 RepID=A0A1B8Y7Q7_XENTR|eukprot:XP_004916711.1 PREDICTED: uncharacterized protein LOC101734284 isoform X2 [Xenopus tropicalis]